MAQSVSIPNRIVQISPTSSAPQITDIKDNGYLWRTYPSDTLQGKVLAQAVIEAFGKGATVNVGARNDALASQSIVDAYPVWVQQRFLFAAIRAALEVSDVPLAQRYLEQIIFAQLSRSLV